MKMTPATDLADLTYERREKYAKKLFAYETVMAAMVDAAKDGAAYYHLRQTIPATLSNFEVTIQLIKKLKEARYEVSWVQSAHHEMVDGKPTGAFIRYEEMRISWAPIHLTCAQLAIPEE